MLPTLEIEKWPSHYVTQSCTSVPLSEINTKEINQIVEDLTNYVWANGSEIGGIAANLLRLPYSIIVVNLDGWIQELINPQCKYLSPEKFWKREGCGTLPASLWLPTKRSLAVEVSYFNKFGEEAVISAVGWNARLLQHEIDHINGITIIERQRVQMGEFVSGMAAFYNPAVQGVNKLLRGKSG